MRVLFLDIDGVLNSDAYLKANPGSFDRSGPDAYVSMFDPAACARLRTVLTVTGAKLVISSSWRVVHRDEEIARYLAARGITTPIVGHTPQLIDDVVDHANVVRAAQRGDEIAAWLKEHPEVHAYAVVDDSDDMDAVRDRFVRTTWAHGMLDEHVHRLVRHLMRPLKFVDGMAVHVYGFPEADQFILGKIDVSETRVANGTYARVVLHDGREAYVPHERLTEPHPAWPARLTP